MRVTNKPTYACEHGRGAGGGGKIAEAPLAPRPSYLSIGYSMLITIIHLPGNELR